MQNRSRVINKLALVLLSLVVLELVLIGDPVQPVKAIKKKIVLKKLKKLLPLLALVKPKKKIILLPIPIPMFKNQGNHNPYGPRQPQRPMVTADGSAPMSFVMMTGEPGLAGYDGSSMPPHSFSMLPMTAVSSAGPTSTMDAASMMALVGASGARPPAAVTPNASDQLPMAMMMPSMTMTIQSEPGGSSAIELSTNMNASPNSSAPLLLHRPQSTYNSNQNKWHSQQHQQQQLQIQNDHFDEPSEQLPGGEQYYSSPWLARQQPLASPAKLIRNERLRGQYQRPRQQYHHQQQQRHQDQHQHFRAAAQQLQQQSQQPQQPISQQIVSLTGPSQAAATSGKLQQMPILVIKNQWRPSPTAAPREQPARQQQAPPSSPPPPPPPAPSAAPRANSGQEFEEFVPVGPPQMMPVYQNTRDGQLHMTPPPPLAPQSQGSRLRQPEPVSFEQEDSGRSSANSASSGDPLNTEVQTIGANRGPTGSAEQQQSGDHNLEAPAPLQRLPEREQQLGANNKLTVPPNRGLASPVVKGKQQQQQQQQGKQQEPFGGGGY